MPGSHQRFRPVPTWNCRGLCWEIGVGPPLNIHTNTTRDVNKGCRNSWADHTNHFWHHPVASPTVIVWKLVGQHLFGNIIPGNSTDGESSVIGPHAFMVACTWLSKMPRDMEEVFTVVTLHLHPFLETPWIFNWLISSRYCTYHTDSEILWPCRHS